MTHSKPAGIPCVQLTPDYRCARFEKPERPAPGASSRPMKETSGANRNEARAILARLEIAANP